MSNRKKWDLRTIEEIVGETEGHIHHALRNKGLHGFASSHEIMGVIEEEVFELKQAVIRNSDNALRHELLDIATACILGIASIDDKTIS